jgi:putative glutamine amidotransferase
VQRARPLIGITCDCVDGQSAYHSNFSYAAAIEKAGGLPLMIPYRADVSLIPQYVDLLDGILFTGGDDLDPALYGEPWHPRAAHVDPDRQRFELALMTEVEKRRLPALCVCFGCQLLNVHRGGSLHQFIPDLPGKGEHRKVDGVLLRHPVTLAADSQLGRAIGAPAVSVNTYHKQAVKTVGRGLRVVARSDDGIVEGLEDPAFPLLAAVQWHPERLTDEPEHLAPFKLLIEKASS